MYGDITHLAGVSVMVNIWKKSLIPARTSNRSYKASLQIGKQLRMTNQGSCSQTILRTQFDFNWKMLHMCPTHLGWTCTRKWRLDPEASTAWVNGEWHSLRMESQLKKGHHLNHLMARYGNTGSMGTQLADSLILRGITTETNTKVRYKTLKKNHNTITLGGYSLLLG